MGPVFSLGMFPAICKKSVQQLLLWEADGWMTFMNCIFQIDLKHHQPSSHPYNNRHCVLPATSHLHSSAVAERVSPTARDGSGQQWAGTHLKPLYCSWAQDWLGGGLQAFHPELHKWGCGRQLGTLRGKELHQSISMEKTQSKCCLRQLSPAGAL